MSTENKTAAVEVFAPNMAMTIERAEIDSQIATAKQYPRSLEQFKKRALSMATLDLETAESCIYSRPVGKKNGVDQYAEGASIRLAEIVAACYGNVRVSARITEQTERFVKCEGVAHDLESNYAGKSEVVEVTVKTDGTPYGERQRALVAKVCLSKAYRDAVFKVVPKALCKSIIDAANGVISKSTATIEDRQKRAKAWLKSINVTDERLFAALNVKGWSEVDDEKLLTLTGLKTAIGEQDCSVDEAFPIQPKRPVDQGPPQTQAAATTAATTTQTPPAPAESTKTPYESIVQMCGADGVTELQVLAFAKSKKLCNPLVTTLPEVSDTKLANIVKTWPNILPEIKAVVQQ